MAFTNWAAELTRFRDALANQPKDQLLMSSYTDGHGQAVNLKSLDEIQRYEKFLERNVAQESASGSRRTISFAVGYGERR